MATRAAPAASLLTPLAVLVPIVASPAVALWVLSTHQPAAPVLSLLVFAGGLTAVVVVGRFTYGWRVSVLTTIATWGVGIVAWPLWYAISINTSICGKSIDSGWGWLPPTGGAIAFTLTGGWGLREYRIWGVPLALVVAFVVVLLLVLAVPGTNGFCET
jgi:hypothetical protein